MRTLLIDNHDSFTFNLFQLLAEENGTEPIVVRNDEASWTELSRLAFDNVVLSPGPGRPERQRDFGVCAEVIRECEAPLLGVCLGHQGLGWAYGGRVARAPEPLHGRVRAVEHAGSALFAGIPRRFDAVRYHSLVLQDPLPSELEPIAWADDGAVMALRHRTRPQWGVQFHPESIATEHGRRLLANFRDLTAASRSDRPFVAPRATKDIRGRRGGGEETVRLLTRRLGRGLSSEAAFLDLYAGSGTAFWLDSSRSGEAARFSFMGDASGPLAATVAYNIGAREVRIERGGATDVRAETIFDYLERELTRLRPPASDLDAANLPFDFPCGFAGYLGYELKADCGSPNTHRSELPDAALIFADRLIAFDHAQHQTHLLCLCDPSTETAGKAWLSATAARLQTACAGARFGATGEGSAEPPRCCSADPSPVAPKLHRPHAQYLTDIATCKERLLEGESYEICLTNAVEAEVNLDPLELYLRLRCVNPAPFASYLRFGELAVLSSSPERFLRVDPGGGIETKPIKGTARRGDSPAEDARLVQELRTSEKNRAENLMIVDLMRNDLGRVSAVGSVEVPALMEVESYETVHQLVSTVRGRLRDGATALDCVRGCFPPGSMTGAPKLRTMEILDQLEGAPRGIYSGAIGYFGLGGSCDLSVTIRTVVLDGSSASIGAGGAIVLQSEAEREYEEMLLKAAAPLRAIGAEAPAASISLTDPRRAADAPQPASAHDLTS